MRYYYCIIIISAIKRVYLMLKKRSKGFIDEDSRRIHSFRGVDGSSRLFCAEWTLHVATENNTRPIRDRQLIVEVFNFDCYSVKSIVKSRTIVPRNFVWHTLISTDKLISTTWFLCCSLSNYFYFCVVTLKIILFSWFFLN